MYFDSDPSFDAAFDRIEGVILPGVATLLRSLLDAADGGPGTVDPSAHAAEVRVLARELEALTREIGSLTPLTSRAPALPDARRQSNAA